METWYRFRSSWESAECAFELPDSPHKEEKKNSPTAKSFKVAIGRAALELPEGLIFNVGKQQYIKRAGVRKGRDMHDNPNEAYQVVVVRDCLSRFGKCLFGQLSPFSYGETKTFVGLSARNLWRVRLSTLQATSTFLDPDVI